MAKNNFAAVMTEVFRHEGGYVNHPKDPGGETNFGITKRTYPNENIRALTRTRAEFLYRRDFWDRIQGDALPVGIDLVTMDPAVNSGVSRGVKWLQKALAGVAQDGVMGKATLARARASDPLVVIPRACAARMGFLRGLKTWSAFGRGWSRRVASVEAVGVAMAARVAGIGVDLIAGANATEAETSARRQTQGATASGAGSAGGLGLADLPPWALAVAGIGVLVLIVMLLGRARHARDRAEAYRKVIKEE